MLLVNLGWQKYRFFTILWSNLYLYFAMYVIYLNMINKYFLCKCYTIVQKLSQFFVKKKGGNQQRAFINSINQTLAHFEPACTFWLNSTIDEEYTEKHKNTTYYLCPFKFLDFDCWIIVYWNLNMCNRSISFKYYFDSHLIYKWRYYRQTIFNQ